MKLQARQAGAHRIRIEPFYDGVRQGAIELPPISVRLDEKVERPELPSPIGARAVPHADLYLRVYGRPLATGKGFALDYVLYPSRPELRRILGESTVLAGTVELSEQDWRRQRRQLERLWQRLSLADGAEVGESLATVGRQLYAQLFPQRLQQIYERIRGRFESWLILTDGEPWLPWELVKPTGAGWEDGFLGEVYQLGRWIEGWGVARQAEIPLGQVNFAPDGRLQQLMGTAGWTELIDWGTDSKRERYLFCDWPGGYRAAVQYETPVWGLHFASLPDELSPALRELVPVGQEGLSTERVKDRRLNLQQKRPLVTFGMVTPSQQTALTEIEERWVPTFIQSGASAFVGALWATTVAADQIFWRAFYEAFWAKRPLGAAVLAGRQAIQQQLPDSYDWLAYFLVGDPMAQGYVPRLGDGYVTLECLNHDVERPLRRHESYSFRASVRKAPPTWYGGRRQQTELPDMADGRLYVQAPTFEIEPEAMIPLTRRSREKLYSEFKLVPTRPGEQDIFVKFLNGASDVAYSFGLTVRVEGAD